MTWRLRDEAPLDCRPIHELNSVVFGRADEPELIDSLRDAGDVVASIVALEADRIIGHILFSKLAVTGSARAVHAAALAPMAVHPARQRSGIGSALVRRGLDVCGARDIEVVIVLGHPAYYPRFGFSAATAARLRAPFSGPAFMALELVPGALEGFEGTVRYAPAFGLEG